VVAVPGDRAHIRFLDGAALRDDPKGPLFRTSGRGTGKLIGPCCRKQTPRR